MIYVFLAQGFEECEALVTVDILKRAGYEVKTVAVGKSLTVVGTHNIPVIADIHESEIDNAIIPTAVILPGGMPGTLNLDASEVVHKMLKLSSNAESLICALCAAPSILGKAGYLQGKRATCFPGFESELHGAIFTDERVVVDGNIITSKAMGCASEFALAIIEKLTGKVRADEVARSAFIY